MQASWIRRNRFVPTIAGALALVLATALPAAAAAPGWTAPRRVVAALSPLSVSAAIDADGHLHVAYLEDHERTGLVYATDRGGWHKEVIAPDLGFEAQPSIALDAAGHVFIAFARMTCPASPDGVCDDPDDVPISRIFIASDQSGTWRTRARTVGPADVWPALAVDAQGRLHIAFQRQLWPPGRAGSGVWEATNAGGTWHESQVASGEDRCWLDQIASIVVTPVGRTWIAYAAARVPGRGCGGSAGIRVASRTSGAWTRETVTSDRDDMQPVLALDPTGGLGLVFDRGGEGIRYTRRHDGRWRSLVAVSTGAEGSLAFDARGVAHVAAEGGGGIQVAVRTPSGFARTTVYRGPVDYDTYGGPAIVLAPATGLARVVFGRSEPDSTPLEDELGLYLVRERSAE